MYIYKNGDACPCCGEILDGLSDLELQMFSVLMASHNIEPLPEEEEIDLEPISDFPPPDAGINPPIKPISKF